MPESRNVCAFFMNGAYKENFLNINNFPQCFFSIVALFAEDSNYNLEEITVMNGNLIIKGYNGQINELYLRYCYNHNEISLVVARVQFINKRKGNMTKLYNILKNIQKKYSLKAIMIECVSTESMMSWCLKNNFVEDIPKNYIENNYLINN